jgi:hypothetical protein
MGLSNGTKWFRRKDLGERSFLLNIDSADLEKG